MSADDAQPLYRRILQALSDDISSGQLSPGARLPTHRELADELKSARGTIAKAYSDAEKLGLVTGAVGSGTFVLGPDSGTRPYSTMLEPPTVASDLSANYPLTGVDPDPADALRDLAARPDRMAILRYQPPLGIRRHRMAGADWAGRFGVEVDHERVVVCSGAQHALFVTFAHLLDPGDSILVEEWSYPGLIGIAETLRIKLVPLAMDRAGLDLDALEHACRARRAKALYCMPTVHNPIGSVLSLARRQAIAELARRYDLHIVEDAAHDLLLPSPPAPLLTFAPERTFFVASTSKALSAGLRVAFLVAPAADIEALGRKVWATQWMVSPLAVELVASWLDTGTADAAIRRKRLEAARRQSMARRIFAGHDFHGHPNAYHCWLKLPRGMRADEVATEARAAGVAVTPGSAFWMRASRPSEALRIALGGVNDRRALGRGLTTLARIVAAPRAKSRGRHY